LTGDHTEGENGWTGWFDARVSSAFIDHVGRPTSLQKEAWGRIRQGEDVCIISPTGSGKTLAALMAPLDAIVGGRSSDRGVSILYISPMKALGRDLLGTLRGLSDRIGPVPPRGWMLRSGKARLQRPSRLSIGLRTGDVAQAERRRILTNPPDILLLTPENLLLMLCSSHRKVLLGTAYIVIDEVHELIDGRRGALLALSIEYLTSMITSLGEPRPQRIGLSATARKDEASEYISGRLNDGGKAPCSVLIGPDDKEIELRIRTLPEIGRDGEEFSESLLDDLEETIDDSDGSLVVFRNTRSGAEMTARDLRSRGRDDVLPHHGSLGPELREEAESSLKAGQLKCIVSSTSLELGIDIGSLDVTVQIGSPKDPARLLQRTGRAGHGLNRRSECVLYPTDPCDLLDTYAVARAALEPTVPRKGRGHRPLDVLAQFIVGASLKDEGTSVDEVFEIARRTRHFHRLRKADVAKVAALLTSRLPGIGSPPPRLRDADGRLVPRRNTRQAFYLNCGTIPKETNLVVVDHRSGRRIGDLSRSFGDGLYEGDVFVLGSRTLRVVSAEGQRIRVLEDPAASANVPSWSGEVPSRPERVSREVFELWRKGLHRGGSRKRGLRRLLLDRNGLDHLQRIMASSFEKGCAPSHGLVPVEVVGEGAGRKAYIFHLPEGRSVTEPVARVLSYGLRRMFGARMEQVAGDDGFAILSPVDLKAEDIVGSVGEGDIRERTMGMIRSTGRFGGRDTGYRYRKRTIEHLTSMIDPDLGHADETPALKGLRLLAEDALSEAARERMDISRAVRFLASLRDGRTALSLHYAAGGPGPIGKGIVRSWTKGLDELLERGGERLSETLPGWTIDLLDPVRTAVQRVPKDGAVKFLLGDDAQGMGADEAMAMLGLASPEDLERAAAGGAIFPLRSGRSLRYFKPEDLGDPVSASALASPSFARVRSQFKGSGLRSFSGSVPFVTHPLEIAIRCPALDHDDIRSALIGRRLGPCLVFGASRIAAPWVARALSSLREPDVGDREAAARIPAEMEDLVHPSEIDPLPWIEGPSPEGDLSFERGRRLLSLLGTTGPVPLKVLEEMVGWTPGIPHQPLIELVQRGLVIPLLVRMRDPSGKAPIHDLWVVPQGRGRDLIRSPEDVSDNGGGKPDHLWVPSSDPLAILEGLREDERQSRKVRGSSPRTLFLLKRGTKAGTAQMTEGPDLVRVHELEVYDHNDLLPGVEGLVRTFEAYGRLGFGSFTVESIMGIPAIESTIGAMGPLMEAGFETFPSGTAGILARGLGCEEGWTREEVVLTMLASQGLLPGSHVRHPLDVLFLLGSVADRWEVLSRLGRCRYSAGPTLRADVLGPSFAGQHRDLVRSVLEGTDPPRTRSGARDLPPMEDLPELKDLLRKHALWSGHLDQGSPVWSVEEAFGLFPARPAQRSVSKPKALRVGGVKDEGDGGSRDRTEVRDVWGSKRTVRKMTVDAGRHGRGVPKGVHIRAWALRAALALGAFTMSDLLAYSPGLGPPARLRAVLADLCRRHLRKVHQRDPSLLPLYVLEGVGAPDLMDAGGTNAISIVSSRDRMSRVLAGDVRSTLGAGGNIALAGGRPIASFSLRRAPKGSSRGAPDPVQSSPRRSVFRLISHEPGSRKATVSRAVRRRLFELGIDTVTKEEIESERELYASGTRPDRR